jgi:hypothetical protein
MMETKQGVIYKQNVPGLKTSGLREEVGVIKKDAGISGTNQLALMQRIILV